MFKNHKKVLLFDLETDSLNYFLGHILEFGYVYLIDGKISKRGSILVDWGIDISDFTTQLTSITKAEIDRDGVTPEIFFDSVTYLLEDTDLLISHNINFDVSFLHHFLLKMGLKYGIETFDTDYLDTLTLVTDHVAVGKKPRRPRKNSKEYAVKMVKWEEDMKLVQSHKLESICKLYNIELNNAHRALADTEAVYEILKAFKNNNPKVSLDFYVNKIGYKKRWKINELSYYPSRISLSVQGQNGERYILDAEEHNLFK